LYHLLIGHLVTGQAQFGNEISGPDKTLRWSDPSIGKICREQLPSVGANRITS
jgi:hypothetical protein